jgi:hypothetical protein
MVDKREEAHNARETGTRAMREAVRALQELVPIETINVADLANRLRKGWSPGQLMSELIQHVGQDNPWIDTLTRGAALLQESRRLTVAANKAASRAKRDTVPARAYAKLDMALVRAKLVDEWPQSIQAMKLLYERMRVKAWRTCDEALAIEASQLAYTRTYFAIMMRRGQSFEAVRDELLGVSYDDHDEGDAS